MQTSCLNVAPKAQSALKPLEHSGQYTVSTTTLEPCVLVRDILGVVPQAVPLFQCAKPPFHGDQAVNAHATRAAPLWCSEWQRYSKIKNYPFPPKIHLFSITDFLLSSRLFQYRWQK